MALIITPAASTPVTIGQIATVALGLPVVVPRTGRAEPPGDLFD